MTLPKIYFRADASLEIGYGHFTRTLALASMLKENFDCTFFTQTPSSYQIKEVNSICKLVELPSDDTKFDLFLSYLNGDEIVFLDNYFFTSEYQKSIKEKGSKLVCIGGNDRHYYADLLINTVITDKNEFSVEPYTKLCLGIEWTILRQPFIDFKIEEREPIEGSVVLCFGGTDQFMITENIVEILNRVKRVKQISVIATNQFDKKRLTNLKRLGCSIYVNQTAEEIVSIFAENELAILSASTVSLEALTCGIPVIAGYYVDNQTRIYDYLEKNRYIIGLGYLLYFDDIQERLFEILDNINNEKLENKMPDFKSLPKRYINEFNKL